MSHDGGVSPPTPWTGVGVGGGVGTTVAVGDAVAVAVAVAVGVDGQREPAILPPKLRALLGPCALKLAEDLDRPRRATEPGRDESELAGGEIRADGRHHAPNTPRESRPAHPPDLA